MNFRVWIKSKAADRVLAPLREELIGLIEPGSVLLDIGSGTGDLLFRAAPRISRGYGIDIDEDMTRFAEQQRSTKGIENIEFVCGDARSIGAKNCDVSTSTLCLHELAIDTACEILDTMTKHSKKVLVADYSTASTFFGQISTEIDEMISGHYGNYRRYRNYGNSRIAQNG